MLIYRTVLSDNTLQAIDQEQQNLTLQPQWQSSALHWQNVLLEGIDGECLSTEVSSNLKELILNDIAKLLPPTSNLMIQHYLWMRNSGIAWHEDSHKKFGATIYLNKEWHVNWGGIFLYAVENRSPQDELKAVFPAHNTMIVNDLQEYHAVTPVNVKVVRTTLQIWGT